MKKLLSIIIALAMMLSLAACGSSTPAPEDTGGEQQNEQQGGTHQNGELTQTEKEKLVSTVLNLSAFGKDSEDNPYKWLVLDVDTENKKALLIMDGYIDTMYMFADDEVHTWENSQVREYLNFQPKMDVMFTAEEQEFILETAVANPANPKTGVSSGNDTTDRLFLLSTEEMEKYFENPEDRVVYDAEGSPVGQYLRTAGGEESYFAMIIQDNSGEIDYNGSHGYSGAYAIRPAMWVDVSGADLSVQPNAKPSQSSETDVQLGTLQIFDKSAITALRIEGENSGVLNDRQLATTGICSIFEHEEWIQFYPVGDAEVIDIYYFTYDEKADYSKRDAQWLDDNGRHFTRLYNQKNESFPDGYWGASYFDPDMGTGYFDFVFATEEKAVAVMTVQVFEEDGLQNYTDAELIALNDGTATAETVKEQAATEKEQPKAEGGMDLAGFMGTKTGKFYSQFTDEKMYMKYETVMDGMTMTVISATKGDKVYSESIVDGVSSGVTIMDGEKMYVIDHASKMIITMALNTDAMTIANTIVEESDVDMGDLVKGTKEIDGKKYDTEEWLVEGESAVMCFDGNDLKYMISTIDGMEMVIKVVEISNKVDDKLFELPSGYTQFAM
ncbi:MAG: hypothetical protein IJN69_08450 [Oscillospiraceae bacterium]|nr:hypothetical protein [Oscillospiraceae bacterium]